MLCPYLMDIPFQKWLFLIQRRSIFRGVEYKNRTIIECIKNKSLNTLGMRLRAAQNMLNDSLDQGSLIRLEYASFFFSIPKTECAYKRYAYKKHVL